MKHSKNNNNKPIFQSVNYKIMVAGGVIFLIGILLMLGGKSDSPDEFNPEEVYSFARITLAPILVVTGLLLEVIAIIYRKKKN